MAVNSVVTNIVNFFWLLLLLAPTLILSQTTTDVSFITSEASVDNINSTAVAGYVVFAFFGVIAVAILLYGAHLYHRRFIEKYDALYSTLKIKDYRSVQEAANSNNGQSNMAQQIELNTREKEQKITEYKEEHGNLEQAQNKNKKNGKYESIEQKEEEEAEKEVIQETKPQKVVIEMEDISKKKEKVNNDDNNNSKAQKEIKSNQAYVVVDDNAKVEPQKEKENESTMKDKISSLKVDKNEKELKTTITGMKYMGTPSVNNGIDESDDLLAGIYDDVVTAEDEPSEDDDKPLIEDKEKEKQKKDDALTEREKNNKKLLDDMYDEALENDDDTGHIPSGTTLINKVSESTEELLSDMYADDDE